MSIELYDSDAPKIDAVLVALGKKQGQLHDLESYRQEIISRFAEAGFVVEVTGMFKPSGRPHDAKLDPTSWKTDIVGRIDTSEFDYDRQSWEIVNDVAGIEPDKKGQIIKGDNQIHSAPTQH